MMNINGILPQYKLVKGFQSPTEETVAFDSNRYPMVTKAIQLTKNGRSYGIGDEEICIVKLNKSTQQYEYDQQGYENVLYRPARKGSDKPVSEVHVPNAELMRMLRDHAELSKAIAGMEKAGMLDGKEVAIQEFLKNTFELLAKLPYVNRQTVSAHVREAFPKSE